MANDQQDTLDRWLAINQSALRLDLVDGDIVISGSYLLSHEISSGHQQNYEAFDIKITVPADFPKTLPTVYETAGRIPRDADNHINENGSICFGVPEIIAARRPDLTIVSFLSEILHDYFLGYLHFAEFGVWPFGEIKHGYIGVIEELAGILECSPDILKIRALLYLLSKKHRRDRWDCPCKSKKRLGECCRGALNRASRSVSRGEAKDLLVLSNALKKRDEYVKTLTDISKLHEKLALKEIKKLTASEEDIRSIAAKRKFNKNTVSLRAIHISEFKHNPFPKDSFVSPLGGSLHLN